jgi:hypothetical protein
MVHPDNRSNPQPPAAGSWGIKFVPLALLILLGGYLATISPQKAIAAAVLLLGLLSFAGASQKLHAAGLHTRRRRLQAWLGSSDRSLDWLLSGLGFALAARAAAGDGPQVVSSLAVPLWVAGMVCTWFGLQRRTNPIRQVARLNKIEWLALAGLMAAAFAVRTWKIGSMPYVLSGDEGSIGLTGWEFVDGTRDNPLGLGWFSFPSLYFWVVSWSQVLFGRTIHAIRLVSAFAGALTVPVTYLLLRSMFNRTTAWLGAIWLACFHQHIFFSRIAYNNIFDGLSFSIAALGLWSGAQTGRRSSFLLAGIALGISQYFYTTARLIPLVLGLWTIHLTRDQADRSRWAANLFSMAWLALIAAMPLFLLYLQHPESLVFTASRVSMIVPGWIEPAAAALGTTPLGLVLEQIWITASGLTISELQGVYFGSGVPLLFGVSSVLFFLGFLISVRSLRDPRHGLPLLTLLGTLIIGGLSIQAPNAQRMLLLPPVLALWVAIPLDSAVSWLSARVPTGKQLFNLTAGVILGVAAFQNVNHMFREYFPAEDYGSLNGEVTMEMISVLREESPEVEVYFVGGERMYFNSIPSLPYLLPGRTGKDLEAPFEIESGGTSPRHQLLFFILPEQTTALEQIPERYIPGVTSTRYNRHGRLLFYVYRYPP